MIYLDTSVALAHLLSEDRVPPEELWQESLVSSRLLEYEMWTRIHAYGLGESHDEEVKAMIGRVSLLKLDPTVLVRALMPFPRPVRTLDAIHLASFDYLLGRGQKAKLASYDTRMLEVARDLGFDVFDAG